MRCLVLALVLVSIARCPAARGAVVATTTVTTYQYNADGAPTAITTQVDDGAASTVYLTWDNFVPDADDPTTGTVSPNDGNLAAVGDTPSSTATTYAFDRRDRLVGYAAGTQALTYTYHPDGTMASSTTADGAGFAFYYDGGRLPQMMNMRQRSGGGLWSAHLGPVRLVSDGSAQTLLAPRKDVAGAYDPSGQTLSAFRYGAYGAQTEAGGGAAAPASYDIHDNPFRYAGEYRDALWQGQYLRARWYDPQRPTFLSRDPLAHLNRYGYGAANPVMMTDPGGMRAGSFARDFDEAVDWLDSGWRGHVVRLTLSPLLYALEIVAHPVRFWGQVKTDPVQDSFIATSLLFGGIAVRMGAAVSTLEVGQTAIGLLQAPFSGFDDLKSRHFDVDAFVDTLESAVGASLLHADTGIVGREPYRQTIEEVENERLSFQNTAKPGEALLFRVRDRTVSRGWTSPLAEKMSLGIYHEMLVAITYDGIHATEYYGGIDTMESVGGGVSEALGVFSRFDWERLTYVPFNPDRALFMKVGAIHDFDREVFYSNPTNLPLATENAAELRPGQRAPYRRFWRNCHTHTAAILKLLRN